MLLNYIEVTRGMIEECVKGNTYGLNSLGDCERKVMRKVKRKHNDINHIKRVSVVSV